MTGQFTRDSGTGSAGLEKVADTSTASQLKRTAQALRISQPTTHELRDLWNVMHGAGRIDTLRNQYGWKIHTVPTVSVDAQGRTHRGVARYVLIKEGAPV
ncbi:hypothetical protein EA796_06650 [Pseudomonas sp. AOB-7]|uniref:helix-turn-helix domain-containing protein n=1 Tax=Pseudomonas sp. AOB-7 TaxID=2482750 RepID=UPI000EFD81CD|nr:helix-turn-helix domain-containing protein [Pseudomonas sp. AOB-7]RMH85183.1 hypothetical protein EA796_06650 [Pseudomonas sp. AOB-7]